MISVCPNCGGRKQGLHPSTVVMVSSGKKPKKAKKVLTAFHEATMRVAERMEPQVSEAYLTAVAKYQKQIDEAAIRSALASGSQDALASAIGPSKLGSIMANGGEMEAAMANTIAAGGEASAQVLEAAFGVRPTSFKAVDPVAALFAREQAGTLIVQISAEVLEAVRIVLEAAQLYGLTVAQQARAIRTIVGLPPNWAGAPLNLANEIAEGWASKATGRRLSAIDKARIRKRIREGTVDQAFIDEMMGKYTASLLNRRALNIARTETIRSAIEGQHSLWEKGLKDGILPRSMRRMVLVTPDDRLRETHAAVPGMNVSGVKLDYPFSTPWGNRMNPPWEPLCRCGVGLIFPGFSPADLAGGE